MSPKLHVVTEELWWHYLILIEHDALVLAAGEASRVLCSIASRIPHGEKITGVFTLRPKGSGTADTALGEARTSRTVICAEFPLKAAVTDTGRAGWVGERESEGIMHGVVS